MKPLIGYLSFTGRTGSYASLPLSVLAGATTFTIEVKFSTASTKNSSNNYTWATIIGREIGDYWQDDFGFCVNGGKLCFWAEPQSHSGATYSSWTTNAVVNDGEIHKVAVTCSNGNTFDIYCDGANVAHFTSLRAKITANYKIGIAYNLGDSNSYLQMDLYELRLWNVARSAVEIFADITGTETGLQGWYLPTADGLKDYSGNNRHATLYGSPAYGESEVDSLPVVFTADVERVIKNSRLLISALKAWLPFDESATLDRCGNSWTAYGSPTISTTNAINGKALQLDGSSYLQATNIELGGKDFTICGYCYTSANCAAGARVFNVHLPPDTGTALVQLRHPYGDSSKWRLVSNTAADASSASLNTQDSGVDPTGKRCHFEVVYQYAAKTMKFFIDGVKKAQWTNCPQYTRQKFTVDIGNQKVSSGENYPFTGTIDEFMIFDGVALHTENFTPPTVEEYEELAFQLDGGIVFTIDVERKLSNVVEFTADVERKLIAAWRYFNAGTADTLITSGTTLTDLPETKSITGTAFYQTAREKCFDLPTTPEVWIKFDVYFDGSNRWRAYNSGSAGNCGLFPYDVDSLRFWANSTTSTDFAGIIKMNKLQTVILHMVSGSSAGIIEAWVDGTKIYTYTGDVNHGEDFADIYLQSDGAGTFFSNVVISNKDLTFADGYQTFTADVERRTTKRIEFTVDVEREVRNDIAVDFVADVEIVDFLLVTFVTDVERRVIFRFEFIADVEILDVMLVEFTADINRAIKGKVKLFAIDNSKYFSGDGDSGTLNPAVIPSQETIPAAPDNTIGLQSIEISLSEQQLTDNVSFVGVVPFDIMFPVQGQYLDYVFDMRVERVQQKGVLYTCDCCVDVDQLLYTQMAYTVPPSTEWHGTGESTATAQKLDSAAATAHAYCIANALGKTPVIQFDTFQSTVLIENVGGSTYADLIRDVFGWSSRVPTHMINVFIRNDKIYFVQRGYEARLLDLTGTKHTIPIVTHELVRMTWGSTPWSKTETREVEVYRPPNTSTDTNSSGTGDNSGGSGGTGSIGGGSGSGSGTGGGTGTGDNPGSGSGSGSDDITVEEPDDGGGNEKNAWLNVGKVTTEDSNGVTVTTYTYDKDGVLKKTVAEFTSKKDAKESNTKTTITNYNDDGLVRETSTTVEYPADRTSNSRVVTTYGYLKLSDGKKFLSTEMVSEYDANDKLVDQRVTTKSPTGRGQGTSDDDAGGSSGSGNIGDDRVTPYQRAQASKTSEAAFENALGDYDSTWDKALNDYTSSAGTDPVDVAAFKKNFDDSFNDAFKSDHESNYYTERQSRTLNGLSLYDSSFPIHNVNKLMELTEAIKWLNRRTKETVTMTIYEYPHLIDFNDRILFNGAEYFLVSNVAMTNARIFNEQRITFVRWY